MFAQIFDVVDFEPVPFEVFYRHPKMIEFPTGEKYTSQAPYALHFCV